MTNSKSKVRVYSQWLLEGLLVVWVLAIVLHLAFPETFPSRRLTFAVIGGTFLVYEFGRWLADKLLKNDEN